MSAVEQVAAESAHADQPQDTPGSLTPVEVVERYLTQQEQPEQEQQAEDQPEGESEEPVAEEEAEPVAEDAVAIDPEAKVFEVNGKKVSLNELTSGHMMHEDYTRKTQELAQQRASLPQEVRKQVEGVSQEYSKNLQVIQRAVQEIYAKEITGVNWNALAEENPAEFVRLSARAQQVNTVLGAAQEELARVEQQRSQAEQQARQAQIQESLEMLPKVIPGWSDSMYQETMSQGSKNFGLDQKDIAAVTDWKILKVLHMANQYMKLQDSKSIVQKKVVTAPKMLKPGTAQPARTASDDIAKLKAKARSSGSKDDAIALISRLYKGK